MLQHWPGKVLHTWFLIVQLGTLSWVRSHAERDVIISNPQTHTNNNETKIITNSDMYTSHMIYSIKNSIIIVMECTYIINPRRACAARVTVLGLSFCLSVCPPRYSGSTRN